MKSIYLTLFIFALLLTSAQAFAQAIKGGEVIGRHIYGLATDYQGDPVLIEDKPLIYSNSQFDQEININEAKFLVSGFNDNIGSIYITQVDTKSDKLIDTVALNLSSIDGLSHPVGGSKTTWNSTLFTESQLIDAANPSEFIDSFKPYYKGKPNLINPYKYGWISEVIVLDSKGEAKAIKNYVMGRVFANQVMLMPDGKTVYMLDSQGNLYLFVADQANSLTKGKLFAVSRDKNKIKYTLLGQSSALKVKFKLKKIKFNSIFKTTAPKNQQCRKKYHYINTAFGEECVQLKSKNKKYAGFFEPIRIRALKGIAGFTTKNNTMTFNANTKQMLFAQADQTVMSLSVGQDQKLNSQFIIKEPK